MQLVLKFKYLFLLLILLLGFFLRFNNLTVWPRTGATFDEYAWTWLGISLIQQHKPISWSPHGQYINRKPITYQKTHFVLVTPYLEHPPLFGLVAGSYALLNGVRNMFQVDVTHIRGLALLLGVISIFFVYLFSSELYGVEIGLLSALLYATIPTVVIGSRIVQNENFFIPFFLLALYFITNYIKTKSSRYRNGAAIVCGLLTLAKVPWFSATVAIVLILLYLKQYKDITKFLAIVIPLFSLFLIYGFLLDAKLFVSLWQLQLHRYDITFNSFFALFTSPYLADRYMIDGWIYFGWFAVFLLLTKDFRKHYSILFAFLAYFAVFVFAIPDEPGHGWYRYPFYPFMIIASALFIKEYFNKNYFLTFFFLMFTGLALLQFSWAASFGFSFFVFRFFLFIFGSSLLPVFFHQKKLMKLSHIVNYASFIILFLLNIWVVLNYNEQ